MKFLSATLAWLLSALALSLVGCTPAPSKPKQEASSPAPVVKEETISKDEIEQWTKKFLARSDAQNAELRKRGGVGQGNWFPEKTRNEQYLRNQTDMNQRLKQIVEIVQKTPNAKTFPVEPLRTLMRECEGYMTTMEFIMNEA